MNWPTVLKLASVGAIGAALIAGLVALIGHLLGRANAKLQAQITLESASLAGRIADQNAKLHADVSRQGSELSNRMARENASLSAKLSANLKLADMRQAWINALRSDMAELQALAVTPDLDFQRNPKFYELIARIELSMNPRDPDYAELSKAANAYNSSVSWEKRQKNDIRYIRVCQNILKREWDVLKEEIQSITS